MSLKSNQIINNYLCSSEESSSDSETINVDYIIREKPDVETVRDFMRYNICNIVNEDDMMFENII